MTETARVEAREAPAIYEYQMRLSESVVLDYFVSVDEHVSREDLKSENFWKHVAPKLKPFTKLRVAAEDGSFYSELLVLNAGHNWAVVREILYLDLVKSSEKAMELVETSQPYITQYKGTIRKWCIVRQSDGSVIQDGIENKDQAFAALSDYLKVVSQ